ncbi:MAG: DUF1177 domain-containing protein [Thermoproteota archaeon]
MSLLRYVLDVIDLLDRPEVPVEELKGLLERGEGVELELKPVRGGKGETLFVKFTVRGTEPRGRRINVIGRLGGIGARPVQLGLVSDADGAIVALSVAAKLAAMAEAGDRLPDDVVVTTHLATRAPVKPYKPAPMMESPVDIFELLALEVDEEATAVVSIDATKANLVVKHTGFAITPTVKEGWILKVSSDLIDIYTRVTGEPPVVVPITMQDILPFSTPVYHINSIVQPWIYTSAPVVGVAITARTVVPGSATGATNAWALEQAARFVLEVVKEYTMGRIELYDREEWETIMKIHGPLRHIMSRGAPARKQALQRRTLNA